MKNLFRRLTNEEVEKLQLDLSSLLEDLRLLRDAVKENPQILMEE